MRAEFLNVRCSLIDETFAGALAAVNDLPKDEYAAFLNRLLSEVLSEWATQSVNSKPVVLIAPEDAGFIKSGGVEIRPDARVSLGVILLSTDGRVEYENTVGSRINMVKAELMPLLDKILFAKADT